VARVKMIKPVEADAQTRKVYEGVVQQWGRISNFSQILAHQPAAFVIHFLRLTTQRRVPSEREREIVIGPAQDAPVGMCFMPVTGPKTVKNRVHLDLTSSAADRDQEVDRLIALGARRVDIGQTGAESWTVLADPEGNEFCVVQSPFARD